MEEANGKPNLTQNTSISFQEALLTQKEPEEKNKEQNLVFLGQKIPYPLLLAPLKKGGGAQSRNAKTQRKVNPLWTRKEEGGKLSP